MEQTSKKDGGSECMKSWEPALPTVSQPDIDALKTVAARVYSTTTKEEGLQRIRLAVNGFAKASAGGPSGLRLQHLIDLVTSADRAGSLTLILAIEHLVQQCTTGEIHPMVARPICADKLHAPPKSNNG